MTRRDGAPTSNYYGVVRTVSGRESNAGPSPFKRYLACPRGNRRFRIRPGDTLCTDPEFFENEKQERTSGLK